MGYDGAMIIFSLIVILIALAFGYLVALTKTTRPTLGDVILSTATSHYGFIAGGIILFTWWATS